MRKFSVIIIMMIMLLSLSSIASAGTSAPFYLQGNVSYKFTAYNPSFNGHGSVQITLLRVTPNGDVPVGSNSVTVRPLETTTQKLLLASNLPPDYYKVRVTVSFGTVNVYSDQLIQE
ncbi:hypothetical protein ACFOQM_01030 [Paenibacillus sp. GCM10012307]|uniref:Uncharacterized protein n=1 Tax=Paenibacillus roseus TaxID=2798579 RepID=A0A934MTB7_9BACL|nr:hypothetical protein [Paenibacillus roseus]MBJ6359907.1 hypothetical protein [Paenibacillus roseus]